MRDDVPLAAPVLGPAGGPHEWENRFWRWDLYYAVVLAATLLSALAGPGSGADHALAGAGLLAMVPLYLLAGRPEILADMGKSSGLWPAWRAQAYLAGLAVAFAVAATGSSIADYVLLALCPAAFMAETMRRAVPWVVLYNALPVAILVLHPGWTRTELAISSVVAVSGIAFSLAFASWINGIIQQSEDRAELIGQLEATRTELAAAHREAGMLAERQRLSAEIHDTLAQGFTSIVMLLQAAEASLETDPAATRHHLDLATATARENLAEARALVAGLAPAPLNSGGSLDDALRRVSVQARQGGIATDVEVTGAARALGTGAEVMLLRVCQEALSNVRKHARASRAVVRLAYDPGQVRLEVSDDGDGFDPAAASGGYGLRGMRARVAEAGGTLEVASAPSAGTAVTVTVRA